jgi:uncharacterized protein (DUF1499 family)
MNALLVNTAFLLISAFGCLAIGAIVLNNQPLNAPPGFMARIQKYLTTNIAETRHNHEFPELELRCYPVSPEILFSYVEKAIIVLGWEEVEIDAKQRHLHVVAESTLFKFKDDIEIQLQPADRGTELQVRSSSRVGKGDFGANARHITDLMATLARIS